MCGSGSVFRIRIQDAPEFGSNTYPDPQHCLKVMEIYLVVGRILAKDFSHSVHVVDQVLQVPQRIIYMTSRGTRI